MPPLIVASKASYYESKALALSFISLIPLGKLECLTTHPSGARFPLSTDTAPISLIGLSAS